MVGVLIENNVFKTIGSHGIGVQSIQLKFWWLKAVDTIGNIVKDEPSQVVYLNMCLKYQICENLLGVFWTKVGRFWTMYYVYQYFLKLK